MGLKIIGLLMLVLLAGCVNVEYNEPQERGDPIVPNMLIDENGRPQLNTNSYCFINLTTTYVTYNITSDISYYTQNEECNNTYWDELINVTLIDEFGNGNYTINNYTIRQLEGIYDRYDR